MAVALERPLKPPRSTTAFGFIRIGAPRILDLAKRQNLERERQFHLPPCPVRNGRRRERELERSARLGDSALALRDRTKDRACPRSPAGAAAFRASMLATSGRRQRWCGSHRRDRFESAPALVRLEKRTHRSKDQGHRVQS